MLCVLSSARAKLESKNKSDGINLDWFVRTRAVRYWENMQYGKHYDGDVRQQ